MMKLKMSESKFGAPVGMYKLRFVELKETEHPEYGPGLEWKFEITEGEHKGKVVSRTTAPVPTPKNSCGTIVKSLTGGAFSVGQELDVDSLVGRHFQGMVEANSTGTGTRLGTLMPLTNGNGPSVAPLPPKSPPAPPLRASAATAVDQEDKFWVDLGGKGVRLEPRMVIQQHVYDHRNANILQVMKEDQSGGWKPASEFAFNDNSPF